jgi:hypothetical protein
MFFLTDIAHVEEGSRALGADESYPIAIQYKGTSASATITVVAATGITLKQGALASEAVDTTVGSSSDGIVRFATDTTLGAVVDRINASPNWHAEIIDGLRTDAVDGSQVKALSEYTLAPRTEFKALPWDTSAHLGIDYRISARRNNFNVDQDGWKAALYRFFAICDIGSGALTIKVYDVDKVSGTTVLLGSYSASDNSEKDSGAMEVPYFLSQAGHDLLVRFAGSGDFPDTTVYLRVVAKNFAIKE